MSYQEDFQDFDTSFIPDLSGPPEWDLKSDSDQKLFVKDKPQKDKPQNVRHYARALVGALSEASQELALLQQIMDLSARLVTRGLAAEGAAQDAILQSDYQAMQRWRSTYGYPSGKPLSVDRLRAILPPDALTSAPPTPPVKSREL